MKLLTLSALVCSFGTAVFARVVEHVFYDHDLMDHYHPRSVAVDDEGNTYICGYTRIGAVYGPAPNCTGRESDERVCQDIYIEKRDPTGQTVLWGKHFDEENKDECDSLFVHGNTVNFVDYVVNKFSVLYNLDTSTGNDITRYTVHQDEEKVGFDSSAAFFDSQGHTYMMGHYPDHDVSAFVDGFWETLYSKLHFYRFTIGSEVTSTPEEFIYERPDCCPDDNYDGICDDGTARRNCHALIALNARAFGDCIYVTGVTANQIEDEAEPEYGGYGSDGFLIKFSANDLTTALWVKRYGYGEAFGDADLGLDMFGNVYVSSVGVAPEGVTIQDGTNSGDAELEEADSTIIKFNADGEEIWRVALSKYAFISGISVNSFGSVFAIVTRMITNTVYKITTEGVLEDPFIMPPGRTPAGVAASDDGSFVIPSGVPPKLMKVGLIDEALITNSPSFAPTSQPTSQPTGLRGRM